MDVINHEIGEVHTPVTKEFSKSHEQPKSGLAAIKAHVVSRLAGLTKVFRETTQEESIHTQIFESLPMYQLPGDTPLASKDVSAYMRSNEQVVKKLDVIIEESLKSSELNIRAAAIEAVKGVPEGERAAFVRQGLIDQKFGVRSVALRVISAVPDAERAALIKQSLMDTEVSIRQGSIKLIPLVPETDQGALRQQVKEIIEKQLTSTDSHGRSVAVGLIPQVSETDQLVLRQQVKDIILKDLDHPDWVVRYAAMNLLTGIPEEERSVIVERGLNDPNSHVRFNAIKSIDLVAEAEQSALRQHVSPILKEGFTDNDPYICTEAARLIRELPEEERVGVIRDIFSNPDFDIGVRLAAIPSIRTVPEIEQPALRQQVSSLIRQGLGDQDVSIRRSALLHVKEAPEGERAELVRDGLTDDEVHVRLEAIRTVQNVPEGERVELISKGFADMDAYVRRAALAAVKNIPEGERAGLVRDGLTDVSSDVRLEARAAIKELPESEKIVLVRQSLIDQPDNISDIIKEYISVIPMQEIQDTYPHLFKEFQDLAATTALYKDVPSSFYQHPFEKSGSQTVLYDMVPSDPSKSFRNRVIKRIIPSGSYFEWKKAFEAVAVWKAQGFDYVPVEPIVRVGRNESFPLDVDVYTRVLPGPSLSDWLKKGCYYRQELTEARDRIKSTLTQLGIKHGHLHDRNFVLIFDRDANGKPNLYQPPRIYIIDFDMAKNSLPQESDN